MVDIPFPTSTAPGSAPQEGGGRLINCYAEALGETGPGKASWHRVPGSSLFATTGLAGFRGAILVGNLVWAANLNKAYQVDSNGVVTLLAGTMNGSRRVSFSHDNAASPNIYAVDLDNGAFLLTGGGAAAYNGGGVLPQPNSVSFQDGYTFFTVADKRVFATDINASTMNALTFTTIQSRPSVALVRGVPYGGAMLFYTTSSCEIWTNTAQPAPAFPYSRLKVIDRGLISANAIAGWEDGFGQLMWVGDDNAVYMLSNLVATKVSPSDLDRLIRATLDKSTLDANCYVHSGRSVWTIAGNVAPPNRNGTLTNNSLVVTAVTPTSDIFVGMPVIGNGIKANTTIAGVNLDGANTLRLSQTAQLSGAQSLQFPLATWCWEFSINTQKWNERASFSSGQLTRWRGLGSVNAFGRWLLGDFQTGNLIAVDESVQTEVAQPLLMRLESGPVQNFPNRIRVGRVDFYFVTGVGIAGGTQPTQTNPMVAISWSDDGGLSWGTPILRPLGVQANGNQRVFALGLGLSGPQGRRWRLDISDAVYASLVGGSQAASPRAN